MIATCLVIFINDVSHLDFTLSVVVVLTECCRLVDSRLLLKLMVGLFVVLF